MVGAEKKVNDLERERRQRRAPQQARDRREAVKRAITKYYAAK